MVSKLILLISAFSLNAFAHDNSIQVVNPKAGMFDVKEVKIEKISVENLKVKPIKFLEYVNDCTTLGATTTPAAKAEALKVLTASGETIFIQPALTNPNYEIEGTDTEGETVGGLADISLDQIINLGQRAWKFLTDNKPVVNARTSYASALPRGVKCWDELDNWKQPRSEVYRATYYNGFGFEVVTLDFRLIYTYGGKMNDLGNYLTNATIQYSRLDVAWGFNVDAEVEVPQVVNVGKKADPVAGMQISVHWKVLGFNHVERTASFFVYGDGRPTAKLN